MSDKYELAAGKDSDEVSWSRPPLSFGLSALHLQLSGLIQTERRSIFRMARMGDTDNINMWVVASVYDGTHSNQNSRQHTNFLRNWYHVETKQGELRSAGPPMHIKTQLPIP
jgi:hypothetical protein